MNANELQYPRLFLSGEKGSAGKTTVTTGLLRAMRNRGVSVQPFKKGPDFIDPMWHSLASGRRGRNLDFFMMGDSIRPTFLRHGKDADLSIIEGNRGLFDGVDLHGKDSSAGMAAYLESPVVLVIDTRKMSRGIAPLLLGYQAFEPGIKIGGVILNQVGGGRHESGLRKAVEHYTGIPVVGAFYRHADFEIDERHLGLMPAGENPAAEAVVARLGRYAADALDLDLLVEIAAAAGAPSFAGTAAAEAEAAPVVLSTEGRTDGVGPPIRVAVALDKSFSFYYPENIEALERGGARIAYFSPLEDAAIPAADLLYFGGGFPELYLKELEANRSMRESVRRAGEQGMPIYAECGGLIYLCRTLTNGADSCSMVALLPADIEMTDSPVGRGYMELETPAATGADGWVPAGIKIRCHEFHHTRAHFESLDHCQYRVVRGYGVDGKQDGILSRNILASYAHIHVNGAPWWAENLLKKGREYRNCCEKPVSTGIQLKG